MAFKPRYGAQSGVLRCLQVSKTSRLKASEDVKRGKAPWSPSQAIAGGGSRKAGVMLSHY